MSEQGALFVVSRTGSERPIVKPGRTPAEELAAQLERVAGSIGADILDWLGRRVGQEFRMADLCGDICGATGCAPDSPRRVLGELRRRGLVNVELLSRQGSLYRVVSVVGVA